MLSERTIEKRLDSSMGSAYFGVIVVEVLVLAALWGVGTYFSAL